MTEPVERNIGYKNPPIGTRFQKGKSGNPRGRPRGAKNYKTILSKELHKKFKGEGRRARRRKVGESLIDLLVDHAISGKPGFREYLWPLMEAFDHMPEEEKIDQRPYPGLEDWLREFRNK